MNKEEIDKVSREVKKVLYEECEDLSEAVQVLAVTKMDLHTKASLDNVVMGHHLD